MTQAYVCMKISEYPPTPPPPPPPPGSAGCFTLSVLLLPYDCYCSAYLRVRWVGLWSLIVLAYHGHIEITSLIKVSMYYCI